MDHETDLTDLQIPHSTHNPLSWITRTSVLTFFAAMWHYPLMSQHHSIDAPMWMLKKAFVLMVGTEGIYDIISTDLMKCLGLYIFGWLNQKKIFERISTVICELLHTEYFLIIFFNQVSV